MLCGSHGHRTEIELAMLAPIGWPAAVPRQDKPLATARAAKPHERRPGDDDDGPAREKPSDQSNHEYAADDPNV